MKIESIYNLKGKKLKKYHKEWELNQYIKKWQ